MNIDIDSDFVIELTRSLVRFPSVNPPGDELEVARYLAEQMDRVGIEAEVQPVAENRANVIGRVRGGSAASVVYTGHLDVVPPGEQQWRHEPFDGVLEVGRLYGRGSCDMKGGVAAIVAGFAALVREGFRPSGDLVIACTAGEEAGMIGAQTMVKKRSLEGAGHLIVAEPSGLQVYIGEKGVLWLRIRAYGQTAHGSMPELGVNAVSFLTRLIPRLEAYPFDWQESALLGRPSLSVNAIRGGNKINVVPDMCEIEVDMRTVPGQNHAEIVEKVRSMAREMAADFDPRLRVEVEVDNDKQSLETAREERLVVATVESVTSVLGKPPEVGGVTFGTDAALLGPAFGIPMVICGPGASGMAHQPDEYVEIDQLIQAAAIYADLAHRLVG